MVLLLLSHESALTMFVSVEIPKVLGHTLNVQVQLAQSVEHEILNFSV